MVICGIFVPDDFKSDGASIPRLLKPLFQSQESKYTKPAILHDWLYYNKCGYFYANRILYEAMKEYKVNWLTRILFWLAVTLFGWIRYYKVKEVNK